MSGAARQQTVPELGHFIDGAFRPAASGAWLEDVDPARGVVVARLARGIAEDVDAAVQAARGAQPAWAALDVDARCDVLEAMARGVEQEAAHLARMESQDTGKPVHASSTMDIPRAVRNLRFFASFARGIGTEEHIMDGGRNYTHRRPVGVAGLVTPWNLPLYLLTWKVAPALAAGNTVVAKPSELTPQTATALCRIAKEAGLPDGVLNVVHGLGPEAGQAIVEHPHVGAISFTGGTTTGAQVARTAAPMFKKLSLELGGKNPTVVLADADLDAAVAGAVRAGYTNAGQVCLCGSRVLVHESMHEAFLERFLESVQDLHPGDPMDASTRLGSLVSHAHRDKVESCIRAAAVDGATVHGGGRPDLPEPLAAGAFLEPAVLTGVEQQQRCVQEEIFGPVVSVQSFRDDAEALQLANGVRYGLAATVWSRDADHARRVAEALDVGLVWVNDWLVRDLRVPFGGMKDSGVGREGGRYSMEFFTEACNVWHPV